MDDYWNKKSLEEMSLEEWEGLCDNCGKCCLHKLEDEESGDVYYTRVACSYLDQDCRCKDYPNRKKFVPDCVELKPEYVESFDWLPATCAYRLLAKGEPLKEWHPLISGNRDSVHESGVSVKGKVLSEEFVHISEMEEHIVCWVDGP